MNHTEKIPEGHEDVETYRDDEASLLGRSTRQASSSIALYILISTLTVSVLTDLVLILHPNKDVSRYGSPDNTQILFKLDTYVNSVFEI